MKHLYFLAIGFCLIFASAGLSKDPVDTNDNAFNLLYIKHTVRDIDAKLNDIIKRLDKLEKKEAAKKRKPATKKRTVPAPVRYIPFSFSNTGSNCTT